MSLSQSRCLSKLPKRNKNNIVGSGGVGEEKILPVFSFTRRRKKKEVALGCLCRYGRRVAISVELLENIKISKLGMMGSI